MRRPLLLLLALFAVGALVFQASQTTAVSCCGSEDADELAWVRDEFKLDDAALAKVRQVHTPYRMSCSLMSQQVAAKKQSVYQLAVASTNVSAELERELAEAEALRLDCQKQMLNHFYEVSQAMPPEQGKRYLSEMCQTMIFEPSVADNTPRTWQDWLAYLQHVIH